MCLKILLMQNKLLSRRTVPFTWPLGEDMCNRAGACHSHKGATLYPWSWVHFNKLHHHPDPPPTSSGIAVARQATLGGTAGSSWDRTVVPTPPTGAPTSPSSVLPMLTWRPHLPSSCLRLHLHASLQKTDAGAEPGKPREWRAVD